MNISWPHLEEHVARKAINFNTIRTSKIRIPAKQKIPTHRTKITHNNIFVLKITQLRNLQRRVCYFYRTQTGERGLRC